MTSKKSRIGDICELNTAIGLAYLQYAHDGDELGQLMRVLPGTYSSRPDIAALAKQKELYFVFYTLEYAMRAKHVEIVSNQPIPAWAREFPVMRRRGGLTDEEGTTINWTIAPANKLSRIEDLEQALKVRGLSPEQRKLPLFLLCPHQALVRDIERGWTPERDDDLNLEARRRKSRQTVSGSKEGATIEHYLYFPKKKQTEEAAKRLEAKGWLVEIRLGADGKNWLALAKQPAPVSSNIEEIREELERLAEELNGEYDGWGAAV